MAAPAPEPKPDPKADPAYLATLYAAAPSYEYHAPAIATAYSSQYFARNYNGLYASAYAYPYAGYAYPYNYYY